MLFGDNLFEIYHADHAMVIGYGVGVIKIMQNIIHNELQQRPIGTLFFRIHTDFNHGKNQKRIVGVKEQPSHPHALHQILRLGTLALPYQQPGKRIGIDITAILVKHQIEATFFNHSPGDTVIIFVLVLQFLLYIDIGGFVHKRKNIGGPFLTLA